MAAARIPAHLLDRHSDACIGSADAGAALHVLHYFLHLPQRPGVQLSLAGRVPVFRQDVLACGPAVRDEGSTVGVDGRSSGRVPKRQLGSVGSFPHTMAPSFLQCAFKQKSSGNAAVDWTIGHNPRP